MEAEAIVDYTSYTSGMKKSLEDKVFFEKWIDGIEHFVDFGCADGTLLAEIHRRHPGLKLTGVDMNELMLRKIPIKCNKVCRNLPVPKKETKASVTALNLSSVLHEVYSYGSEDYISSFWHNLNHVERYKYVFVRDMVYEPLDKYMGKEEDMKQRLAWARNIYKYGDPHQISDFELYQGSLAGHSKESQVHFLLKYRYTQNWNREVRENYLSLSLEEIFRQMSNYDCVYLERYSLPHLHDQLKQDFDIDFNEMTHAKMVFKRRGL